MNSEQLARLIAVYSYTSGRKTIDGEGGLAAMIGLSPMVFLNALYKGVSLGLFSVKRKGFLFQKVLVSDEQFESIALNAHNFGAEMGDMMSSIKELVVNYNNDERDVNSDLVKMWLGVPEAIAEVALYLLEREGEVVSYEFTPPKDKKSTYVYLTHADNKGKGWASKSFKK